MAVANSTAIKGVEVATDYGPQGAEFVLGDSAAFGIWKMSDGSFRPGGGVMFAVDDVRAAVERYKAAGVTFEADGDVEETPVCFMAFGTDTEGNTFILHRRKERATSGAAGGSPPEP